MSDRARSAAAPVGPAAPASAEAQSLRPPAPKGLADAIDDALPQTQCTRCGYADCRRYAEAIADACVPINQCPPGGAEGIARLARLIGQPPLALNPVNGIESPRQTAFIDETWCIGCTLCLTACPVDSIVGGPKLMHTVVDAQCTGCERCLPACPVDCISMRPIGDEATGWAAWSPAQASEARKRYRFHQFREARDADERAARLASASASASATAGSGNGDSALEQSAGEPPAGTSDKRAAIQAVLARVRAARGG